MSKALALLKKIKRVQGHDVHEDPLCGCNYCLVAKWIDEAIAALERQAEEIEGLKGLLRESITGLQSTTLDISLVADIEQALKGKPDG